MLPRVLLIDNHDSFTHNLAQLLHETQACALDIVTNDAIPLHRFAAYSGVLVSPGPGVPREAGMLMEALAWCCGRIPVLGVCLGHQAIAELHGGALRRLASVRHGVAASVHVVDDDALFDGLPRSFGAGLYHSWAVDPEALPACLRVTATSEEGVVMALAHRTLDVRGVQFHPESIMTPLGAVLMRNWLTRLKNG